ncbi:uncharacterized protein LOC144007741 [Festucalex cinctus]
MESANMTCKRNSVQLAFMYLNDIVTLLVGPPLAACLLWHSFKSKRARLDVLNINLALFHTCQYALSAAHFIYALIWPEAPRNLLRFMLVYAQTGGPMSLCLICVERYVAVVRPTDYPSLERYRFRELGAAVVWLVSVPTAVLSVLSVKVPSWWMQTFRRNGPFFLMMIMMVLLWRSSSAVAQTLRRSGPGGAAPRPAKRRAYFTVAATSSVTLLCYIPVASMMHVNRKSSVIPCLLTPLCLALLSAASVVHPVLYLYCKYLPAFHNN